MRETLFRLATNCACSCMPRESQPGFHGWVALIIALFAGSLSDRTVCAADPVDVGQRRELFVDSSLIERFEGRAELRLHHPQPREVALKFDEPWEGNASGYATVIVDGDLYRMYYRGHRYLLEPPPLRQAQSEVVCYAESRDGITWTKPKLGLYDWPPTQNNTGNKENNIFWRGGPETHNFAPFLDTRPGCPPAERFKAVGGTIESKGLRTFHSADGIHWQRRSEQPVVTEGAFDSHNTVFWDAERRRYTMYTRFFSEANFQGLRSIGVSYSEDFETWSKPVGLSYGNSPPQQMYTNQVAPYYRAPHILLGFPTRFVARPLTAQARQLEPVRARAAFAESIKASGAYTGAEITDGLFMSSRDGERFHRWDEAFLRPGREGEGRWIYGDNYQSYGLFETRAGEGLPNEISMHFNEGAWRDEMHRLRRYTIRLDGFVSLHAPLSGGSVTTVPLRLQGNQLTVNFATSAAGSLRIALLDAEGNPLPGHSLEDCDELFGDSTERVVTWKQNEQLMLSESQAVKLRIQSQDCDVYSFRVGVSPFRK